LQIGVACFCDNFGCIGFGCDNIESYYIISILQMTMVDKLFIQQGIKHIKKRLIKKTFTIHLYFCCAVFVVVVHFNIYTNISTQLDQTFCTSDHFSFKCQNYCGLNISGSKKYRIFNKTKLTEKGLIVTAQLNQLSHFLAKLLILEQ
jgi:hypothetical protein